MTAPGRPPTKVELLAQVEPFARCNERQIAELAALAHEELLPAGGVLIGQDDRDLDVYIVAAGELEVRIDGVHVATLRAGDLVGEMAMLGNGRRTATVTASTSARVLALDPRDLDDALAAVPGAAEAFARRTVL